MIDPEKISHLQNLLPAAKTIFVMLGPEPSLDQVAAATALYGMLRTQGKNVALLSPNPSKATQYELELANECKDVVGNKDLQISFEYNPEAVDKVSYHIDENSGRFCLIIKPQQGHQPLATDKVSFDYVGAEADLIFLIGVHDLESLEQLYFGYEQLYQDTTLVTIHTFEPSIGNIKIDTSSFSSVSEAVVMMCKTLEYSLGVPEASNLLYAIEQGTQSFQSFTATADTFELVAFLLRSGARRRRVTAPAKLPPTKERDSIAITADPPVPKQSRKSSKKIGGLDYQPGESAMGTRG